MLCKEGGGDNTNWSQNIAVPIRRRQQRNTLLQYGLYLSCLRRFTSIYLNYGDQLQNN